MTLAPDKVKELESLVGTMIQLRYLSSEDVGGIPHREAPMQTVAYAPLS